MQAERQGAVILIIGGSASGKSECAERCVTALGGARVYLATMEESGGESRSRIEKHRTQRAGRGFRTVECARGLEAAEIAPEEVVLLECLSNLVANEMFLPDGTVREAAVCEALLLQELRALRRRCRALVVVGNILTEEPVSPEPLTAQWLQLFSAVQNQLAAEAEAVYRVTAGIPERLK
ncbi:adenosylcobinamide kinase/adenosylcobinamide-phosphate guanylyltransferase [Moryella indoligenes]|uniref:Adenosylcobinamide kinase n=1 Tax=Moryella indoligenes TaxID=371674 RepID=A0AAE3VB14_9FIRM|nr:adenosylcobinamide kinase/adenosylcobinamide-phosphate guanylyltransferase [Moryella indoligenes]